MAWVLEIGVAGESHHGFQACVALLRRWPHPCPLNGGCRAKLRSKYSCP